MRKTDDGQKFTNEFLRWANSCFENSIDIEEYGAIAGKLSQPLRSCIMKLDIIIAGPHNSGKSTAAASALNIACAELATLGTKCQTPRVLILTEERRNLGQFAQYTNCINFLAFSDFNLIHQLLESCSQHPALYRFNAILVDNACVTPTEIACLKDNNLCKNGSFIVTKTLGPCVSSEVKEGRIEFPI